MAATAVYARVSRVKSPGQPDDGAQFSNISATPTKFFLNGGRYGILVKASTYGSVTFQVEAPDGSTMLTAAAAFTADGSALVDLVPGYYTFAIA